MSAPSVTAVDTSAGEPAESAAVTAAASSTTPAPVRGLPWLAMPAVVLGLLVALYTWRAPQKKQWEATGLVASLEAGAALVLAVLVVVAVVGRGRVIDSLRSRLVEGGPWLIAIAVWIGTWEGLTAKLRLLPLPWFPPPASVVQVFVDDWSTLLTSTLYSLRLLLLGALIGAASGFVTGIAIGWWRAVGYWMHPILKFIGPVPATAWLPIVFVVFPTSFSASIFLVALSAWFPVTVLTWSGVASVKASYYDVARTLGAGQWFLVRRVAVPAALPHVFVGLFMGLGSTFVTLIVAEMLGVKAGLGWYIQWAIGWAAYNKMYAALVVMALLFSGLLRVVFGVRDHFLDWQKGLLRW